MIPGAVWPSDVTQDPYTAFEERDQALAVAEAIQALPCTDRAIAQLFFQEQLSLKEIAATMAAACGAKACCTNNSAKPNV